jgi:hypothetical protein
MPVVNTTSIDPEKHAPERAHLETQCRKMVTEALKNHFIFSPTLTVRI